MKRAIAVFLLLAFAGSAGGCSPEWKKKFTRKGRKPREVQAILVLQPDYKAVHPAADRYREHFAFWKSWHGELLTSFGQIKKRDLAYLNGSIGELRSMQVLLTGQPAQRLKEIVSGLDEMEQRWSASPTSTHPASDRTLLESFQREVNKTFHYSNIKQTVVPEPQSPEDLQPVASQ